MLHLKSSYYYCLKDFFRFSDQEPAADKYLETDFTDTVTVNRILFWT